MMTLKPEGHQFQPIQWQPHHPAYWCWVHWLSAVIRNRNIYGPYGRAWECDAHVWICYVRIRWPWRAGITWRQFLRDPYDHFHRDFRDLVAMATLVNGANDPFIEATYEVSVHTEAGEVRPFAQ